MSTDVPSEIRVRDRTGTLIVSFADGRHYELPFEYLRVNSPSAEVQGHGHGEPLLVTGKEKVGIRAVEPIGQYAIRLIFDDGHNTGLYTWQYLRDLGEHQQQNWQRYLQRLEQAGHSRDATP
jgi:DUF971 family protein